MKLYFFGDIKSVLQTKIWLPACQVFAKSFPLPQATLLRFPKIAAGASALTLALFDRGHSSRSLFPPPAAVALVPTPFKNLNHGFEVFENGYVFGSE